MPATTTRERHGSPTDALRATKAAAKAQYRYLAPRPKSHHKQLYVRGRGNLTARIIVGTLYSENLTIQETAADYDLPVEAVRECLDYYERNQELVDAEVRADRISGGLDPYEDKPLSSE